MGKFTLLVTQQCNLRCSYCYIDKRNAQMSLEVAKKAIDFIFSNSPAENHVDIGFFGGEPLLEFERIKAITRLIKSHPASQSRTLVLSIISNGTLFSDEIAEFLKEEQIQYCISCDGPPEIQDTFRIFANGAASSATVEGNIRKAVEKLPLVRVNAVYHPRTFRSLPDTVAYFSALGINQIYLNPDFSADWSEEDLASLDDVYGQVSQLYMDYHRAQTPRFISLIDGKIATILGGGYQAKDRCQMGKKEFAFSPEGNIFPCERLIGVGDQNAHCIGTLDKGVDFCHGCCTAAATLSINKECQDCSLRDYCMRWCGCSNFLATGRYDTVSRFLCASEKAAIREAFNVFRELNESMGSGFFKNIAAWQHPASDM